MSWRPSLPSIRFVLSSWLSVLYGALAIVLCAPGGDAEARGQPVAVNGTLWSLPEAKLKGKLQAVGGSPERTDVSIFFGRAPDTTMVLEIHDEDFFTVLTGSYSQDERGKMEVLLDRENLEQEMARLVAQVVDETTGIDVDTLTAEVDREALRATAKSSKKKGVSLRVSLRVKFVIFTRRNGEDVSLGGRLSVKGKSSGPPEPTPDITPPRRVSSLPADGATGVPLGATVAVTFDEPLRPGTVHSGTFILFDPGGIPLDGTVTYSDATLTATFTPAAPLSENTTYLAVLAAGITDLAGNPLEGVPIHVSFTTVDLTSPTVVFRDPAPGATGVGTHRPVTATFDEEMAPASLVREYITLVETAAGNTVTPESITYDPATRTVTFEPEGNLRGSTTHTVTLGAGITDLAGNSLAGAPLSWDFETGPGTELTPPSVVAFSPGPGVENVRVTTHQEITFTEAMNRATTEAAIRVDPPAGRVFFWNAAGDRVTVVFDTTEPPGIEGDDILAEGTTYTVTVSTAAEDLDGAALEEPASVTWTTQPDVTEPEIRSISPDIGATLALPLPSLQVTFTEPMESGYGWVSVERPSESRRATVGSDGDGLRVFWGADDRLDIQFTTPLRASTEYRVTIGALDLLGQSLADDSEEFILVTAGSQSGAPRVLSAVPASGETGVSPDTAIFVAFSRAMAGDLLDHITVSGNGATEFVTGRLADPAGVLIRPRQAWPPSSPITVSVAATAADASGNALGQEFQLSFTTGEPNTRPWSFDPGYSTLRDGDRDLVVGYFRHKFLFRDDAGRRVLLNDQTLAPEQVSLTDLRTGLPVKGYSVTADDEELRVRAIVEPAILESGGQYELGFRSTLTNSHGVPVTPGTIEFTTATENRRPILFGLPEVADCLTLFGGVTLELEASLSDWDDDPVTVTARSHVGDGFRLDLEEASSSSFRYEGEDLSVRPHSVVHPVTFEISDGHEGHTIEVQRDIFPWNPRALPVPKKPTGGSRVADGAPAYTFTIPAATRESAHILFLRVLNDQGEPALLTVLPASATGLQHPPDNPLPAGSYTVEVAVVRFDTDAVRGDLAGIGLGSTGAAVDFRVP